LRPAHLSSQFQVLPGFQLFPPRTACLGKRLEARKGGFPTVLFCRGDAILVRLDDDAGGGHGPLPKVSAVLKEGFMDLPLQIGGK
jgi:hypothetical protein